MRKIISAAALVLFVTFSMTAQETKEKPKTKEEIAACKKACEKDGKVCTADGKKVCTGDKKTCTTKETKESKKACCSEHKEKK